MHRVGLVGLHIYIVAGRAVLRYPVHAAPDPCAWIVVIHPAGPEAYAAAEAVSDLWRIDRTELEKRYLSVHIHSMYFATHQTNMRLYRQNVRRLGTLGHFFL